MSKRICGRCPATAETQKVRPGVLAEPDGWAEVTVTGKPIRNIRLCRSCVAALRTFLGASS